MICKYCGKENIGEGAFCASCGKPLEKAATPEAPVNMWGEPIGELTREFDKMEPLVPANDMATTQVVPVYTDLNSVDPYKVLEDTKKTPDTPEESPKKNRMLMIWILVASSLLVVLAVVVLGLSLLSPSEETGATPAEKFEYVVGDNGRVQIISYIGNDKTVIIPDKIEDQLVNEITARAFANRNLLNVTVPDSVQIIDETAFEGNPDLVLYGSRNSYIKQFAERHNILFAYTGSARPVVSTTLTTDLATTTTATATTTIPPTKSTTTTTAETTQPSTSATYAQTTMPPAGVDPEMPAADLIGNSFQQIKTWLGHGYTLRDGGLNFPYHAQVVFENFNGQLPADGDVVVSVTITNGSITENARVGWTMKQLQVMLESTDEWLVQPQEGVGQRADFRMVYQGRTMDVTLYFDGEGEDATCIQASVSMAIDPR